jgi:hypothetical protein
MFSQTACWRYLRTGMRSRYGSAAAIFFFFLSGAVFSQESRSVIGNFHITKNGEAEDDGFDFVATITENASQLTLRCIATKVSVIVSLRTQSWDEGASVDIKFHADKGADVLFEGRALDHSVVEVIDPGPLLDALAIAKIASFKLISSSTIYNAAFVLRQPDMVIAALHKACAK